MTLLLRRYAADFAAECVALDAAFLLYSRASIFAFTVQPEVDPLVLVRDIRFLACRDYDGSSRFCRCIYLQASHDLTAAVGAGTS